LLEEDLTSFTPISLGKKDEVLLSAWEAPPEAGKRRMVVYNPLKAQESKDRRFASMKELQEKLEALKAKTTAAKSMEGATLHSPKEQAQAVLTEDKEE